MLNGGKEGEDHQGRDIRDIKDRSTRLQRVIKGLVICLWALLVMERFGWIPVAMASKGLGPGLALRFTSQLVAAVPEAMYLLSLWWIRQALTHFASGDLYAVVISRMLSRVGGALAAGAIVSVFVVPGAQRFLGFGPGYWVAFDVSGLVLGAIGLSLAIVARVLDRARELQAELNEIF